MSHRNPQKRAAGGRTYYAGGNSKVASEAASTESKFASGGKVCDMPGEKGMKRIDKRARGGSVMSSAGGGTADKSPFSSAKKG
jgi:hypothetical protein